MESAMERKRQHVGRSLTWPGHCRLHDPDLRPGDANANVRVKSVRLYELGSLETGNVGEATTTRSNRPIQNHRFSYSLFNTLDSRANSSTTIRGGEKAKRSAPLGACWRFNPVGRPYRPTIARPWHEP